MRKDIILILVLFAVMSIFYCFNGLWVESILWKYIDAFATALTLLLVLWEFYKNRKQLDKIKIVFVVNSTREEIIIDKNLTRKDCQRSEIQGILRTKLDKGVSQYDISYLGSNDYFDNIYRIQDDKDDILKIYLKNDELKDFSQVIKNLIQDDSQIKSYLEKDVKEKTASINEINIKVDEILDKLENK